MAAVIELGATIARVCLTHVAVWCCPWRGCFASPRRDELDRRVAAQAERDALYALAHELAEAERDARAR